jgi:hypothetical protein
MSKMKDLEVALREWLHTPHMRKNWTAVRRILAPDLPRCREEGPIKYWRNGSRKAVRGPGIVADRIYLMAKEAGFTPSDPPCGRVAELWHLVVQHMAPYCSVRGGREGNGAGNQGSGNVFDRAG